MTAPEPRPLSIADDEPVPVVTLRLTPDVISEHFAVSRVTAFLDRASSVDTTMRVWAAPVAPASTRDYQQRGSMLTIAAGALESGAGVTVNGVNDNRDNPDRLVRISGRLTAGHASGPDSQELIIADDDGAASALLRMTSTRISENGGVSTVTARLTRVVASDTTVTLTAAPVGPAEPAYFTQSGNTLIIRQGSSTSTDSITLTAIDNDVYGLDRTVTVAGSVSHDGVTDPPSRTLTIVEDDPGPAVTLHLSESTIDENGGRTTVTATIARALDRETTYTVGVTPIAPAAVGDFAIGANRVLTIAAGRTASTGTVTITAQDDAVAAPEIRLRVAAEVGGLPSLAAPQPVLLAIRDDEGSPTATLHLNPDSIGENGGMSTITAQLDHATTAVTSVRVATAPVAPALAADFRQDGAMLIIPAGAVQSTGTVTITAQDNDREAADKRVRVWATSANQDFAIADPADRTLVITDDEEPPRLRLELNPATIAEDGGASTITARLDPASSADIIVTVTAEPVAENQGEPYFTQSGTTLTIAAGERRSTGTVRITALDDAWYGPDRSVRVTGEAAIQGVTGRSERILTIENDEPRPAPALALTAQEIPENGGSAMLTVTLDRELTADTTYTVSVTPTDGTTPVGYSLDATVLTIAAGATASSGTVTITAQDNAVDAPDLRLRVTAVGGGLPFLPALDPQTLTILDDEPAPAVTLKLTPPSIVENGGRSTVTAQLDHPSSETTRVTVRARADSGSVEGDFRQVGLRLYIPRGARESTGAVTITAVDNAVDAPDKSVVVAAAATNRHGLAGDPQEVVLEITDDDRVPVVVLELHPLQIGEGGRSTVTARLDRPSSAATTVTVEIIEDAAREYVTLEGSTLTIAALQRRSTGAVTILSTDDEVFWPDRTVRVKGNASNDRGVIAPSARTLLIRDDEPAPVVTLTLSAQTISENGGETAVTVQLDSAVVVDTTYTVSATPVAPAAAADFSFGANRVLTIPAGHTASTGTATITAQDNVLDAPDKTFRVAAAVGGLEGVPEPAPKILTIQDDEPTPVVALTLTPETITEDGGATVTATLDRPSIADTTVRVTAAPDAPAVTADIRQMGTILTIPAGATVSTTTVRVAAVNDDVDAPDKTVTVSGAANNVHGVDGPQSRTLRIRNDDEAPEVRLVLSPSRIVENGGESTVTAKLDHPSSSPTTVQVTASAVSPAEAADFTQHGTMLTIAALAKVSTGVVRMVAHDNDVDAPDKTVTVSGAATNPRRIRGDPESDVLAIADDEGDAPRAAHGVAAGYRREQRRQEPGDGAARSSVERDDHRDRGRDGGAACAAGRLRPARDDADDRGAGDGEQRHGTDCGKRRRRRRAERAGGSHGNGDARYGRVGGAAAPGHHRGRRRGSYRVSGARGPVDPGGRLHDRGGKAEPSVEYGGIDAHRLPARVHPEHLPGVEDPGGPDGERAVSYHHGARRHGRRAGQDGGGAHQSVPRRRRDRGAAAGESGDHRRR